MTPIKGLTDGPKRLPRIGKLHLGEKVTNDKGVEYPRAVDHFVVPESVQAVYGKEPRSLDIMFPIEDEDAITSTYLRAYSRSRGLVCKGDGETAHRLMDLTTVQVDTDGEVVWGDIASGQSQQVAWKDVRCAFKDCPDYVSGACREIMMLSFMLPRVQGVGVWGLDTSSYYSITDVYASLAMVKAVAGRVSGIPLRLTVEPREVTPEGGRKKTVHTLHIYLDKSLDDLRGHLVELGSRPMLYALPEPNDDDVDELVVPKALMPGGVEAAREAEKKAAVIENPPQQQTKPSGVPAALQAPSKPQLARLFAMAGKRGIADEDVKRYITEHFGLESTKLLTQPQYDQTITWIEQYAELGAAPADATLGR